MVEPFATLQQISAEAPDLSYSKVHRALSALFGVGLVHPWRGQNNELRLTIDDALRLRRLLGILRNRETLARGVEILRLELQEERIRELEHEVGRLRALVEVRPSWIQRASAAVRRVFRLLQRRKR